jgi:hypothetical protein
MLHVLVIDAATTPETNKIIDHGLNAKSALSFLKRLGLQAYRRRYAPS